MENSKNDSDLAGYLIPLEFRRQERQANPTFPGPPFCQTQRFVNKSLIHAGCPVQNVYLWLRDPAPLTKNQNQYTSISIYTSFHYLHTRVLCCFPGFQNLENHLMNALVYSISHAVNANSISSISKNCLQVEKLWLNSFQRKLVCFLVNFLFCQKFPKTGNA